MTEPDCATGDLVADPPPRLFRVLVAVTALMALITAAHSYHYTRAHIDVRFGKDIRAQRATMLGVPFFKRSFLEFNDRLARTVPRGAKILVEPLPQVLPDGSEVYHNSGQARWFLYLNHYAYPSRVYVRQPELASGTLVDYPRWLDYHFVDLKGPEGDALAARDAAAIDALGLEYRLRYPVTKQFVIAKVQLDRRVDGEWQPIELAGARRAGADSAAAEGEPGDGTGDGSDGAANADSAGQTGEGDR